MKHQCILITNTGVDIVKEVRWCVMVRSKSRSRVRRVFIHYVSFIGLKIQTKARRQRRAFNEGFHHLIYILQPPTFSDTTSQTTSCPIYRPRYQCSALCNGSPYIPVLDSHSPAAIIPGGRSEKHTKCRRKRLTNDCDVRQKRIIGGRLGGQ